MDSPALRRELHTTLERAIADGVTPGGACRVVRGDRAVEVVVGALERVDAAGREIPVAERRPLTADTWFDLASLTKIVTALTMLRLCDDGVLDLDAGVGEHLEPWRTGEKATATLRHLLTHTAGTSPVWTGWQRLRTASRDELVADLVGQDLTWRPGERMTYSCVGYQTAMALAEQATGEGWEALTSRLVLRPLGLGLTFRPDPARCAPTELDAERGLVVGQVHDEAAWALGGVSGNAGLFGTLDDVARLGEAVRGALAGDGILGPESSRAFAEDQLPRMLGTVTADNSEGYGQSCGLRLGQLSFMGARGVASHGHTGFTGTSVVVDPDGLVVVLLTNRVHPTRNGPDLAPTRARVAELAREWA